MNSTQAAATAARSSAGAIVATSINPHDRLAHQLRCFRRWQSFGMEVLSFNTTAEREALRAAGLPDSALIEVDASESMLPETRRSNPRILPVLQRLRAMDRPLILLVNADLYPAATRNPLPLMSTVESAVCWARRDCLTVDDPPQAPGATYFGGLDAFQFSRDALAQLVDMATAFPESAGMAFGIPGWDMFVAHLVASQGAVIAASHFLLHPQHASSYQNLDSFAPLARRMIASGRYAAKDHVALAAEFALRISQACARHEDITRLLFRALTPPPCAAHLPADDEPNRSDAWSILRTHMAAADYESLRAAQRRRRDWAALHLAFRRFETSASAMVVFLLALEAAAHQLRALGLRWVTHYPTDAMHGLQRQNVLADTDPARRLNGLLALLGSDLLEHGILNLHLLKYVLVHCRNEAEQRRFGNLMSVLKDRSEHDLARAA
jgi:hypothetical protein